MPVQLPSGDIKYQQGHALGITDTLSPICPPPTFVHLFSTFRGHSYDVMVFAYIHHNYISVVHTLYIIYYILYSHTTNTTQLYRQLLIYNVKRVSNI